MPRPPRLEFAGALHHVTARGNRRESLFVDDHDRTALLDLAARFFRQHEVSAYAYCLMGTHYHFVLRTAQPNLSRLMMQLNGAYTHLFNRRHGLSGHVFEGRFKGILVEAESHFLEVCRYVELNPVRAGLVDRASDWPWSSHRANIGTADAPEWLDSSTLWRDSAPNALMTDDEIRGAQRRHAEFVAAGRGVSLWDKHLREGAVLGSADFAAAAMARHSRPK